MNDTTKLSKAQQRALNEIRLVGAREAGDATVPMRTARTLQQRGLITITTQTVTHFFNSNTTEISICRPVGIAGVDIGSRNW